MYAHDFERAFNQVFQFDQNVGISLKRIFTKFEFSSPSRFQH